LNVVENWSAVSDQVHDAGFINVEKAGKKKIAFQIHKQD
jgi:hypothetical protein